MTAEKESIYQSYFEFWHKHRCPLCGTVNWTCHSHSERSEPIHSPDACECRSCGKRYWMMSKEDVNDTQIDGLDTDVDEISNCDKGIADPNRP